MRRMAEKQVIYRELTLAGVALCAVLGLGLEVLLFLILGIRILEVPAVVLGFLWLLSGILVSGVLLLAASFQDRIQAYSLARTDSSYVNISALKSSSSRYAA